MYCEHVVAPVVESGLPRGGIGEVVDIEMERRVSGLVMAQIHTIQPKVRGAIDPIKLHRDESTKGGGCNGEVLSIPRGVEWQVAVESVCTGCKVAFNHKVMWYIHSAPGRIVEVWRAGAMRHTWGRWCWRRDG